jgi:hypothetical protein
MYVKDPVTRCWVWVLGTNGVYGMIDKQPAHRVIYKKYKKKLSKKLQLDHLCKNTLCVNPDHLEPVTAAINIQRSRLAKLNADDVIEIRRRFALGVNQDALAREYGVTTASIYNVVMRRTWKNINAA